MLEAFLWGAFAASSLIIGGAVALLRPVPRRTLGLVLAFGAGVPISAVAYELALEAFTERGAGGAPRRSASSSAWRPSSSATRSSNLPESFAATANLREGGRSVRWILGLWVAITLVSGGASLAGYALLDGAPATVSAFVLAFAGGAILTMLADTMMPEAFANGGKLAGVVTSVGFAIAFVISTVE